MKLSWKLPLFPAIKMAVMVSSARIATISTNDDGILRDAAAVAGVSWEMLGRHTASVGAAMASVGARKTLSIIHFLSEDVVSLAESPLSIVASPSVLSTVEFSLNFCSEQRWIQPSRFFTTL